MRAAKPSPATVIAFLAIFVGLIGPAVALDRAEVRTKHFAKGAVKSKHLRAGAITTAKLRDGSVTEAKLRDGLATLPPGGLAGGDLTGGYPNPLLAAGSVGAAKLRDGAVQARQLGGAAVAGESLVDEAVRSEKLGADSVDAEALQDGVAAGPKLAAGAVTTPRLANGAVTNIKLPADAITGSKVAPNALGGAQVNEAALDYGSARCKTGLIHSWARIKGTAPGWPTGFTSSPAFVDRVRNCSGGVVRVRRFGAGSYAIEFDGDPSTIAIAALESSPAGMVARAAYTPVATDTGTEILLLVDVFTYGDGGSWDWAEGDVHVMTL